MHRRFLLLAASAVFTAAAAPKSKVGDSDWLRRFRFFMKVMNEFLMALNEGAVDIAKWQQVRSAWHHLEDE